MKNLFIPVLTIALLAIASCKKEGDQGPVGPAGPALTGDIIGFVDLYDAYGNLQHNLSGVLVTVQGLSRTATTDSTGRFELDSMVTGTYNLDFTFSGYGNAKVQGLGFAGGGNVVLRNHAEMSQVPGFYATTATTFDAPNNLVVSGAMSATDSSQRKVLVFANDNPGVSSAPGSYRTVFAGTCMADSSTYRATITWDNLHTGGFPKNSTVYFAVYGSADVTASSSYLDVNTGEDIFNAISTATPATTSTTVVK